MDDQHFTGGCRCGGIRYSIRCAPHDVSHCHCSMCRRSASAPFLTWLEIPADRFELISGTLREYQSSDQGMRSFCPTCGCQILFQDTSNTDIIYVTAASLDDPEAVTPVGHNHAFDGLRWIHIDDDLPKFVTEGDQ